MDNTTPKYTKEVTDYRFEQVKKNLLEFFATYWDPLTETERSALQGIHLSITEVHQQFKRRVDL